MFAFNEETEITKNTKYDKKEHKEEEGPTGGLKRVG